MPSSPLRRPASLAFALTLFALVGSVLPGAQAAAAPANDNFASAQVVGPTLPVSIPASNVGATAEPGEKPHFSVNVPNDSVWFRWTAPSAARVTVSACQPDKNFAQVAVYTGDSVGGLTPVAQFGECIGRFNPVPGTKYSIAVEGIGQPRAFTFELRQFAPPANDAMANPLTVGPTLPVTKAATNVDSSWEAGEPAAHGGGTDGRSVWFKWVAPESTKVRVDVCDFEAVTGAGNAGIWVYKAPLVAVAANSNDCRVSFDAVGGTDYRIAFSGTSRGEGPFTLRLLKETPPANDAFAAAKALPQGLPISEAGTTLFSTVQAGEPHHGSEEETSYPPSDSVWYRWTPSTSAETRIRACDADFGARLGVYTGAAVGSLTRVVPTVAPSHSPFCSLRFPAQAGTTYRIAVGGGGSEEEGDFVLDLHQFSPPANDDLGAAQPIGPSLPLAVPGTNLDAGAESGEPNHEADSFGKAEASVWYSWTPAASMPVRIGTCGTTYPSTLAVYRGASFGGFTEVGAGQGGCPAGVGGHQFDFFAAAGTTYLIAVDGYRDEEGAFTLSLTDLTVPPAPVNPAPPAAVPTPSPPQAQKPAFNLKKALRKCRKIKRKKPRQACVRKARNRARAAR